MANFAGLMIGNIPITSIYGAPSGTLAAATGIQVAGMDLNTACLRLADGSPLGRNIGMAKAAVDMSAIFAIPTGNTPLPINGRTFAASATSGTVSCSSSVVFSANTSTYTISGTSSSGGATPSASGPMPSGAAAIQYTVVSSTTSGVNNFVNNASSKTTLPSSGGVFCGPQASGTPSTVEGQNSSVVRIDIYNAAGTIISTTTVTLRATAIGTS